MMDAQKVVANLVADGWTPEAASVAAEALVQEFERSGLELLRAFQEDLEERPARRTVAEYKAARQAERKYEEWRKGGAK